jgi:hypothetical protein
MEEFLTRIWHDLGGRVGGPLTFRLLIQPLVAVFLAVRHGLKDGREGNPPYFWSLLNDRRDRDQLLWNGWHDVARLFFVAVLMDLIYQLIVFRWFYPLETLIVAVVLALVPYLVLRGLVTRLAHYRRNKGEPRNSAT